MNIKRDSRGFGFIDPGSERPQDRQLEKRLGRRHARDDRDRRHLARPTAVPGVPSFRYWYDNGWWGDQDGVPQCVGYAWAHYVEDSPKTHPEPGPFRSPAEIYAEAQRVDEWPGEDYEGTSVRAGAKVLQSRGIIGEYLWAFDLPTVISTLLTQGPVIVGTNWYSSMFRPMIMNDAKGTSRVFIRISGNAEVVGGHAYLLNGVNVPARTFRMKNSWGTEWGVDGRASIGFEDFERLLSEDGEACLTMEKAPALTPA